MAQRRRVQGDTRRSRIRRAEMLVKALIISALPPVLALVIVLLVATLEAWQRGGWVLVLGYLMILDIPILFPLSCFLWWAWQEVNRKRGHDE